MTSNYVCMTKCFCCSICILSPWISTDLNRVLFNITIYMQIQTKYVLLIHEMNSCGKFQKKLTHFSLDLKKKIHMI